MGKTMFHIIGPVLLEDRHPKAPGDKRRFVLVREYHDEDGSLVESYVDLKDVTCELDKERLDGELEADTVAMREVVQKTKKSSDATKLLVFGYKFRDAEPMAVADFMALPKVGGAIADPAPAAVTVEQADDDAEDAIEPEVDADADAGEAEPETEAVEAEGADDAGAEEEAAGEPVADASEASDEASEAKAAVPDVAEGTANEEVAAEEEPAGKDEPAGMAEGNADKEPVETGDEPMAEEGPVEVGADLPGEDATEPVAETEADAVGVVACDADADKAEAEAIEAEAFEPEVVDEGDEAEDVAPAAVTVETVVEAVEEDDIDLIEALDVLSTSDGDGLVMPDGLPDLLSRRIIQLFG